MTKDDFNELYEEYSYGDWALVEGKDRDGNPKRGVYQPRESVDRHCNYRVYDALVFAFGEDFVVSPATQDAAEPCF